MSSRKTLRERLRLEIVAKNVGASCGPLYAAATGAEPIGRDLVGASRPARFARPALTGY